MLFFFFEGLSLHVTFFLLFQTLSSATSPSNIILDFHYLYCPSTVIQCIYAPLQLISKVCFPASFVALNLLPHEPHKHLPIPLKEGTSFLSELSRVTFLRVSYCFTLFWLSVHPTSDLLPVSQFKSFYLYRKLLLISSKISLTSSPLFCFFLNKNLKTSSIRPSMLL